MEVEDSAESIDIAVGYLREIEDYCYIRAVHESIEFFKQDFEIFSF